MIISLYTTLGCHLCEDALAMLRQLQARGHDLDICEVEIGDSESLIQTYGIRIPVVAVEGRDDELGWPFSLAKLEAFITD